MDKDTFRTTNVKASTLSDLKASFNAFPKKNTAYFVHDNVCYWAAQTNYDPVFHLCGAAIKKVEITANYDAKLAQTASGAAELHGFTFVHKQSNLGSLAVGEVKKCLLAMKAPTRALYQVPEGARPIVANIQSEKPSIKNPQTGAITESGMKTVHRLYLATAFTILRQLHGANSRDGVVALIVGGDGRIISWGRKNPAVPCWHGETSAIMGLGGEIPKGSAVYSTLKPCKMCSGLIWDASKGDARVFWGQDDPASAAMNTVLEANRTGTLLDGHKCQSAPIYLTPKAPDRESAATTIDKQFAAQKGAQGGKKSAIDYVMTAPAQSLVQGVEAMLRAKVNKYQGPTAKDGQNENVEFVLHYLIGFLDSLNIKFATLGT